MSPDARLGERIESAGLARCALHESRSRGRRYPETPHPYRGEFQRDRDRIIHARAFRRMENKTQVFTRRFSDHFRNRLTHTLEVSQISRTVAAATGLNAELVEALALAHDIGHAPFGHAGEAALNRIMSRWGGTFDHNLQALRIVEEFEVRYAAFPGLNLMFEVREGLVKHSCDYDSALHPELAEYRLDERPPLEAQIIDLTDEIAYGTADLDDAFEAHLLDLDGIAAGVPLFGTLLAEVGHKWGDIDGKLLFNETLRRLLDYFVTDLVAVLRHWTAELDSVDAVRGHPKRLAGFSPEAEAHRRTLKTFLFESLYRHPAVRQENERADTIVVRMFEYYLEQPGRLPPAYRRQSAQVPLHRVVCDYLAGMTDVYIQRLAGEIA